MEMKRTFPVDVLTVEQQQSPLPVPQPEQLNEATITETDLQPAPGAISPTAPIPTAPKPG